VKKCLVIFTIFSLIFFLTSLDEKQENAIQMREDIKSQKNEQQSIISQTALPTQYVCTFFYPWYGHYRHWDGGGHDPPNTWASYYLPDPKPEVYDPASELYNSNDEDVILWQIGLMKRACIRVAISSWWGQDTYEDKVFRKIITCMSKPENPYRDLKWCILYEQEGYYDPDTDKIISDLQYIISNYASSPFYFKINGKPVIFVYADSNDKYEYAQRWRDARNRLNNTYIVLKVFEGFQNYVDYADNWYQYAPGNPYEIFYPYSAYASPGFWKVWEQHETPRLARNVSMFEEAVYHILQSKCMFLLIETWNEWHEGTQIEPGQEIIHDDENPPFKPAADSYGYAYIDAVAKYARSLMPSPVEIQFITPKANSTLKEPKVTVEIKVKDPYSASVEAKISIDGGNFVDMELAEEDAEGCLHFKYTADYKDGDHYLVVYTKDEYDYFSSNAKLSFKVDSTPPTISNVIINSSSGKPGTVFTISAIITDPSGIEDATAYIQHPDEVNVAILPLTNKNGKFEAVWDSTDAVCGNYLVDIVTTDSIGNTYEAENMRIIKILKEASTISFSVSTTKINLGDHIEISGSISPPHTGVEVTLKYVKNGEEVVRKVLTTSDGSFNDTFMPNSAGLWNITVSWPGDYDHEGNASTQMITVEAPTKTSWMLYGTVAVIMIVIVVVVLRILRRRTS